VELTIDKMENAKTQELVLMDGVALFLGFLQSIDPTAKLLCQYDGVEMPPITSADLSVAWPGNDLTAFFLYVHVVQCWSMNLWNSAPNKNGKIWPNVIQVVLHVSCERINLAELIKIGEYRLRSLHLSARLKRTQMKDSQPMISILGAPDGLNIEGLKQSLVHGFKRAKNT